MNRRRGAAAVAVVLLAGALAAGCAGGARSVPPPASAPEPTVTTTHDVIGREGGPSPFRVVYDGHELELGPHTYCYTTECVDGFDLDPPSVGSPSAIYVQVTARGLTGFDVLATGDVTADGMIEEGGDWTSLPVLRQEDGWWLVTPELPAGDYRVMLTARGDGTGDMAADLRWEVPAEAG